MKTISQKAVSTFIFLLLFMGALTAFGQVTIWSETFNYSNGTTSGTNSKWTTNPVSATKFSVNSNQFKAFNTGTEYVWQSEAINISSYSDIDFSVNLPTSANNDATDYLKIEYQIDNGTVTNLVTKSNDITNYTQTYSALNSTKINGTSLVIYIKVLNNKSDEIYYFDNISVTGSVKAPSAISASNVTKNSFMANWTTIDAATGYDLNLDFLHESFENAMTVFSNTGGNYYTGNSSTTSSPINSNFSSDANYSYGVCNTTGTLTSSNINTSNTGNTSLRFNLAAFSYNNTTNGMENTDYADVFVSPDGGTTFYKQVRISGNFNSRWNYNATGNVSRAYSTTPVTTYLPGTGEVSNGYSMVTISNLPNVSNLVIKIELKNNSSNELWLIDNFALTSTSNINNPVNSQEITDLNVATLYKYSVRAIINGVSSANSNEITVKTKPVAASNLDVTLGNNQLNVNYSRGNGDGVLVLVSDAPIGTDMRPADFSTKTINAQAYTSGQQWVYDGTSSSVNIDLGSLSVDPTELYVAIFEYSMYDDGINSKASTKKVYDGGIFMNVSGDAGVLPVSMLGFTAKNNASEVILNWSTASEMNNDYFIIERSKDGINFEQIAQVQGHGTTNTIINYEYTDKLETSGQWYYRLSQVDYDGKTAYCGLLSIQYENTISDLKSWVNGQNMHLSVQSESEGKQNLQLVNSMGQVVYSGEIELITGTNNIIIELPNLSAGTYFIRVSNTNAYLVRKVML